MTPWADIGYQMHELPAIKTITEIVLEHARDAGATRVLSVSLEIGALCDLQDEWVQRYFDHLTRDTVAEGATVAISRVPARMSCIGCEAGFEVEKLAEELTCPRCRGTAVALVSGTDYEVRGLEVI
jgi:hydrogenase nickel incorporation protein HypA/HybF